MIPLIIMGLLLVKHFLGDFVLQTKYQYEHKGQYGHWGGILHALIHGTGTAIVLLVFFDWEIAAIAAFCDTLVHYHVDWSKFNINRHFKFTPEKSGFWLIFGIDQLLHQLTYFLIVVVIISL